MLVILFNPVWVVKTRLALQGAESAGQAKYKGSIGIADSYSSPLQKLKCLGITCTGQIVYERYGAKKASEGCTKGYFPRCF